MHEAVTKKENVPYFHDKLDNNAVHLVLAAR